MWDRMWFKIKNAFLKLRHKLLGYAYVPPPPDPIICPDAIEIEMGERNYNNVNSGS